MMLLCLACGGAERVRPDPLDGIRAGVVPRSEADAVATALEQGHYEMVAARIEREPEYVEIAAARILRAAEEES